MNLRFVCGSTREGHEAASNCQCFGSPSSRLDTLAPAGLSLALLSPYTITLRFSGELGRKVAREQLKGLWVPSQIQADRRSEEQANDGLVKRRQSQVTGHRRVRIGGIPSSVLLTGPSNCPCPNVHLGPQLLPASY